MKPDWFLERARHYLSWMQEKRALFHRFPELSFEEWETRKRVLEALPSNIGEIHSSEKHAGLWGCWKGKGPGDATLGLRADMDALPIEEDAKDGRSYASRNKGIMHACGHDVHMTCLLGALHILKDCEQDWGGELSFIFQPGEEKLPGGANAMMQSGALDKLKAGPLLALHVFPEAPVGTLGFKPGPYMASTDELHIQIKGSGGHAALPKGMTNPVMAAAELTTKLYELPNTLFDEAFLPIVAIGKINAPGATNVIPALVQMEGTIRCLKAEDRALLHASIQDLAKEVAQKHRVAMDVRIEKGYPPLENDPEYTLAMKQKAQELLGASQVLDLPVRMTAEDFAFYAKKAPLVFMRLGTASTDGRNQHSVHHPAFDVDPECFVYGAASLAWLAFSRLSMPSEVEHGDATKS